MKLNYLITGASGFIGRHVVSKLLNTGVSPENIRLAIHSKSNISTIPSASFESVLAGDIRNKKFTAKITQGADIIYHLAAASGFDAKDYSTYREINVQGTENILHSLKDYKLKKFVYFSTIAVYGLPAAVGNIRMWNESNPKKYTEIYGRSKLEAEEVINHAHDFHGLPFTIIRPASVYGPYDFGQLYQLIRAISKHLYIPNGKGENKMDFVYVKDLVNGAILAANSKRRKSDYILGSCNPPTLIEIETAIKKSLPVRLTSRRIPEKIAYVIAALADTISSPVIPRKDYFRSKIRILNSDYYYDCTKAKREIGYNPTTTIQEGIQNTIKWYKQKSIV